MSFLEKGIISEKFINIVKKKKLNFHKNTNLESDNYTLNSAKSNGIIYLVLSVKINEKKHFCTAL